MFSIIVAMDLARGIGKDNDIPWNIPSDMKHFKETTEWHNVIMGRKNYESIPERFRPLKNRTNIVLSRTWSAIQGCSVYDSFDSIITDSLETKSFIIGGGQIYKQAMELGIVDEMIITHVHKTYECDTFFPHFNLDDWNHQLLAVNSEYTIIKYTKK